MLLAASAQAGQLPFTGTFDLRFNTLQPIELAVAGTASVNGSGGLGALGSITLAGGTLAAVTTVPITDPAASPIQGARLEVNNGPGAFSLDGFMALPGSFTLCLFGPCPSAIANVVVPFTQNGTRGVGLGGGPLTSMSPAINLTVRGAGWTVGTAVAPGLPFPPGTRMGFVHGPVSGGASSAAAVSGVVQLVTPASIHTNIGVDGDLAMFGVLELHFIPEPATFLIVTSGLAGLGVVGRRRRAQA
jgi:hypothetical protein